MSLILGLFLMMSSSVYAQDPLKVASHVYKKVILENEKVRVIELEFAPGDVVPWHKHPDHLAYALTDGKLEITDQGKPSVVAEIKAGNAIYLTAVTHMAKNIGTTTFKLIVTELKDSNTKKVTTKTVTKSN
jgi:quercetin dioxygenase-like cupin family protein